MYLRRFSTMTRQPISISISAWDKMTHILEKSNEYAFVFFATGGGCNGFNYKLESIDEKKFDNLTTFLKCSNSPMPPLAIIGTNVFLETASIKS